MAAQSEGRLVEMFGAGTAAVVSICPHDLSHISFISIFIRILFCHFKNYALLMRPKVLLMWCCWNSSSVSTKWQKVGLNEQEVTVAPTHIHIHIYTFTYICIQNFGEYSDPLPSHPPPKKNQVKERHWSVFLHNFVAHTFQRNVWYCVVWEPAQAVFFPTTDVTNLSRALLQGDKNFQLRSSFRENRERQWFENNLWFVSIPCDMWYLCDIWELFFFLRQSLIKVRVKKN